MDKNLQIALAEANYILNYLTKEEKNKIPEKLLRFIEDNYDKEHIPDENKLNKRTYALLAVIYRKYLAENKEELTQEYEEILEIEKRKRMQ